VIPIPLTSSGKIVKTTLKKFEKVVSEKCEVKNLFCESANLRPFFQITRSKNGNFEKVQFSGAKKQSNKNPNSL
jgi:hypothetical protein